MMEAIRADARHADIEVVSSRAVARRAFAGWSLKLAMPEPERAEVGPDVLEVPAEILARLRDGRRQLRCCLPGWPLFLPGKGDRPGCRSMRLFGHSGAMPAR